MFLYLGLVLLITSKYELSEYELSAIDDFALLKIELLVGANVIFIAVGLFPVYVSLFNNINELPFCLVFRRVLPVSTLPILDDLKTNKAPGYKGIYA